MGKNKFKIGIILLIVCSLLGGCAKPVNADSVKDTVKSFSKSYLKCGTKTTYLNMLSKQKNVMSEDLYIQALKVPENCQLEASEGYKDNEVTMVNVVVYPKPEIPASELQDVAANGNETDLQDIGYEITAIDTSDLEQNILGETVSDSGYYCMVYATVKFRGTKEFKYQGKVIVNTEGKITDYSFRVQK